MKVLVAGANGHTGRLLIQYLKKDGHEPYAMIRKNEQKPEMEKLGGIPVVADLEGDVGHAVRGMDIVMFAAGSGSKTGTDKTTAVDRDGAINLMKATEKTGAKKFIMLSSFGAGRELGKPEKGNETMYHYTKMKKEADEYLMGTELDYTIVRPGGLTHEESTSKIKVGDELERGTIPRADVAKTMIAAIQEPNAFHKAFEMISGDVQIEDALKSL
ncbi:NAD-dependent dehydratase [Virgibacillus phasianinus]|uniref:NAD-dependent dehydratase n=1 Tax=Virgibacillus phasianinus TaxID=2017483 RepID=A0A220U3E2_9BACI|nr:SDR family oxidoreductase [Virgibacillus phasianinus]ASK62565.1 NAD-dependent dehydratase [Virgibacillus phasianinus]